jgi:hypothetical protein
MAAQSHSSSSDDNWDSDGESASDNVSAAELLAPGAAPSPRVNHPDEARNLLVFAADKAGMEVSSNLRSQMKTIIVQYSADFRFHLLLSSQGIDRNHVNRIINDASRGSACVISIHPIVIIHALR